jgi:hypothetical protein
MSENVREIIGNTTATPNPRSDWEQTDETKADYIKNKPTLGSVSFLNEISRENLSESVQESLDKADNALLVSDNISAEKVYFDEDMMVTKEVGYITLTNGRGTIPSKGKNLKEVFEAIWVKEQNPSKTDPSVSITLTGAGSYEVGTTVTGVKYSVSFDYGKYEYGPEPTGVFLFKREVKDTSGGSYTKESDVLNDVEVADDTNFTVTVTVQYSGGSTPYTNKGNECTDDSVKIPGGFKTATSSAIKGYRSYFYGVLDTNSAEVSLTSAIIRGLTNGKAYDGTKSFELKGNDVVGAKRFVVAIPSNSTRGGLSKVILTSAMDTPITDSYIKTAKAVQVEGVGGATAVDYDVWVYEPSKIDAGEIHTITLS